MRWRIVLPFLVTAGLLALTPVAAAETGEGPAAAPIASASLAPATRGAVKQIGPYVPEYPPLPADSGAGRRVVYCNSCQYVWIVDERDTVIRSYPVSGRQFVPGPGTYHVFLKQRYTFSIGNPAVTWEYMVTFTYGPAGGAIGFHKIPLDRGTPLQSESQLGMFLSHGCVRQSPEDAVFMWQWSQLGDTVVVTA